MEKAHGGVYSTLADSMQRPYATLLLSEMNVTGLAEAGVKLTITTGLDALSRGNENDKINHWFSDLSNVNNVPEALLQRLKPNDFMKVTGSGRDVDFSKFLMNDTEFEQAQAQAHQAQATQVAGEALADKAEPEQLAAAVQQAQ